MNESTTGPGHSNFFPDDLQNTTQCSYIFQQRLDYVCEHGMDFEFGCDLETNSPKIFSFALILRPSLTGCRMQNWYIFTLGYFWYIVEMEKICAFSRFEFYT